jgi:hypothetical protein
VIVISGALVLVALVLLVLGLTMTDLSFVYGSIAVSLISFVFLVIGILQRRGEQPAIATSAGPDVVEDDGAPATAVPASAAAKTGGAGPVPVVEHVPGDDVAHVGGATVLVVPGRPRYHVDGCRYLAGKDVEEVDVESARAQYSASGVCKPDAALAASAEPADDDAYEVTDAVDDEVVDTGVPGAEDVDEEPVPAPVRRTASRSGSTAVAAEPRPRKAPARKAAPRTRAVAAEPAAATEPAAAAAPARRGKVVVIPERGRFHTADCRFVRDALGTEELTRTQAARQGYQACGVCKP